VALSRSDPVGDAKLAGIGQLPSSTICDTANGASTIHPKTSSIFAINATAISIGALSVDRWR
jgi:hypothetical protein